MSDNIIHTCGDEECKRKAREDADKHLAEVRLTNPELFKMAITDHETVWVKKINGDNDTYSVENIPVTDIVNCNDIVTVVHDKVTEGRCEYLTTVKQVNDSIEIGLETYEDIEIMKVFMKEHPTIEAEQYKPGVIKLTWPISEKINIAIHKLLEN